MMKLFLFLFLFTINPIIAHDLAIKNISEENKVFATAINDFLKNKNDCFLFHGFLNNKYFGIAAFKENNKITVYRYKYIPGGNLESEILTGEGLKIVQIFYKRKIYKIDRKLRGRYNILDFDLLYVGYKLNEFKWGISNINTFTSKKLNKWASSLYKYARVETMN